MKENVVAVCGGRDYSDAKMVSKMLKKAHPTLIVHGAATGADTLAGKFAQRNGIPVISVPAKWNLHGRSAGPRRNQKIIDRYRPHKLIAFPGGVGTADMVRRAKAAGILVVEV